MNFVIAAFRSGHSFCQGKNKKIIHQVKLVSHRIKAPPSGLVSALPHHTLAMASESDSCNASDSSAASSTAWEENEGESSENDEETPADPSLRGTTFLVTAACPRKYPSELEARKARRIMLPEDFSKEDFLKKFRRVFNAQSNVKIEKATCHDEPHKRFRVKKDRRERHKHVAGKTSANFAHKKVAAAFYQATGLRISFSFRLHRFVGNLQYLMEPGKKASTDIDLHPAKFPPELDLKKELSSAKDPREVEVKDHKKRKRLTFDEVSNIVLEGVGGGPPLKYGKDLEAAAKSLKMEGKVELWNYLGDFKTAKDVSALVCKVWRMHGVLMHPSFHAKSEFEMSEFNVEKLKNVCAWRAGKYKEQVLALSGDGGLCKTSCAEALASEICLRGYWFVDDLDDFRELDGLLEPGDVVVVDEVTVAALPVNETKKLFDVKKTRRMRCRHFNGTIPKGVWRIFCTNSSRAKFFPDFPSPEDRTGVMRRILFEKIIRDMRRAAPEGADDLSTAASPPIDDEDWQGRLKDIMLKCHTGGHVKAALKIATDMGAALVSELPAVATAIAEGVGMKPLEKKRFLQCFGPCFLETVSPSTAPPSCNAALTDKGSSAKTPPQKPVNPFDDDDGDDFVPSEPSENEDDEN